MYTKISTHSCDYQKLRYLIDESLVHLKHPLRSYKETIDSLLSNTSRTPSLRGSLGPEGSRQTYIQTHRPLSSSFLWFIFRIL